MGSFRGSVILKIKSKDISCILMYFFLLTVYVFILPLEDQPDFQYKAPEYQGILSSIGLDTFKDVFYELKCLYRHDPFQMFGSFDFKSCVSNPNISFKRIILTLFIFLPCILLFLFFRREKLFICKKSSCLYMQIRPLSFLLAFIFPSFIYYSSVFSFEQITLMLSIVALYLYTMKLYTAAFLISILIYYFDPGNSAVLILILSYIVFLKFIYDRAGLKLYLCCNLLFFTVAFLFSTKLLYLVDYFDKVTSVLRGIADEDVSKKYPLLARPILTYMSYSFMAPSLSKHILLYFINSIGLLYFIRRIYLYRNIYNGYISLLSTFFIICIIVFILPGYNNAKYYIFTVPLLMNVILDVVGFKKAFCFFMFSNFLVFLDYFLFYSLFSLN